MASDVRQTIVRLLAAAATTGAFVSGVGCSGCPEGGPYERMDPSDVQDLLAEVVAERNRLSCPALCASVDTSGATSDTSDTGGTAVELWSCTYAPVQALTPTEVTCSTEGTDPFVVSLIDEWGSPVMGMFELGGDDCETVCDHDGDGDCRVDGTTTSDASVECTYELVCIAGRRPLAGVEATVDGSDVGAWWAAMAQLEAASVPAFTELARDLRTHGAPTDLVERALEAAADERVHTRLCRARARAHGATPLEVRHAVGPSVDLPTLAEHNAREGCVRETFAALEAGHQAAHAEDPDDRRVLECIHLDEVRHAQLAWDIHHWARQVLGPGLDAHLQLAFAEVGEEVHEAKVSTSLQRGLGLPAPRLRGALFAGLEGLLAA